MLSKKILSGEKLTQDELLELFALMWDEEAIKYIDDIDNTDHGQVIFEIDKEMYVIDWSVVDLEYDKEIVVKDQPYRVNKRIKMIEVPEYVRCDDCIVR